MEEAAKMDAAATSRSAFSEVTEANRKARISFSAGKMLFEVPYELDGTVEFMWVKDAKGKVVAAKRYGQQIHFPRPLLPACHPAKSPPLASAAIRCGRGV